MFTRHTLEPRPRAAKRIVRLWLSLSIAGSVAAAIAGCSGAPDDAQESPGAGGEGFGHIHGLGVDTTSETAYVATHTGVFELPALNSDPVSVGDLEGPIAGRAQDTMGFTMVGADMFGSGHPDPAEEPALTPPNLGLITSTDAAQTWTSVSLRGQTDFHDLAVAPGQSGDVRIYGYDATSGAVMVSRDGGTSWTEGATVALRDLTVDPADPDTVYATTGDGLAVSTDAGATFRLVADAPALYLIESLSDGNGGMIGIAVDGTVWVRTGAAGWQSTGSAGGSVQAMTYIGTPTSLLLVADDRGIVVSDDRGATWRVLVAS